MDKERNYTIEEASLLLNTSVYTVRRRIKENKLKARLLFGKYQIYGKDLYDFINKDTDYIYFDNNGDLKPNYKFILFNNSIFYETLDNIIEEIYFLAIKKEIMFKLTSDLSILYMRHFDKVLSMCTKEEKNKIMK